jgi:hypothetical protein
VLAAAARAGHLVRPNPAFWVTEFSWDSRPPDPQGVPSAVLSRWVADALYRMWADGVSLVTWFQVRDQPFATSYYQSGLWYLSGKQKPALRAFRFPFLALPRGGRVFVWGRTPAGGQGRVAVEWSGGGAWRKVATLVPDRYGVFHALLRAPVHGRLRARVSGEASLPFALTPVPDLRVNPFGSAAPLQPKSPR